MKTTLLTAVAALVLAAAQPGHTQSCDTFYPLKKGVSGEMTSYSPKNKMQSRVSYAVTETKTLPDGVEAEIASEMFDDKNKPITQTTYTVQCRGGNIYLDMESMLNKGAFAGMKDVEVQLETDYLQYPGTLKTGDKLPNGAITMTVLAQGREIATNNMQITNRRVTGTEQITTPAGTFTAQVVEYDLVSHMRTMGLGKPVTTRVKEYISKGAGVVRSETYDANNKLTGYTVLTKLQR